MSDRSIWSAFAGQVVERPGATALVWRDGAVSYDELHRMATRALDRIHELGVEDGQIVGVPATKSPATIAIALACLHDGRPVMLPSPTLPRATLDQQFARAGCRYVVDADTLLSAVDAAGDDATHGDASSATLTPADNEPAPPSGSASDIGFVLTTSGSTGLPKLVPLGVDAVERFTAWAADQFEIGPGTTVLNYAPLNFDLCFLDVWTTLLHGGSVVLVDPDAATSGDHLIGLIADHHVDVVQAVPMCHRLMIDAAGDEPVPLDSVRHVIFTGDHMPSRTLAQLPPLFPKARLFNIYGCTETNDSFFHEIDPADQPASAVPLGMPLPGVHVIIAGDDGEVVAGEGRGELLVATPFQTPGYIQPAVSDGDGKGDSDGVTNTPPAADKFTERPHGAGTLRYFRTGDIVRRDAGGNVHLEGRNDFQVKVRGTRINTAEVEQALLEHPGVLEAAVIAVPDPLAGSLLHSVVRRAPAVTLNSLVLRQHCAERLPKAAVPSVLRLVDEPLPKTSTGKVDRKAFDLVSTTPAGEP